MNMLNVWQPFGGVYGSIVTLNSRKNKIELCPNVVDRVCHLIED